MTASSIFSLSTEVFKKICLFMIRIFNHTLVWISDNGEIIKVIGTAIMMMNIIYLSSNQSIPTSVEYIVHVNDPWTNNITVVSDWKKIVVIGESNAAVESAHRLLVNKTVKLSFNGYGITATKYATVCKVVSLFDVLVPDITKCIVYEQSGTPAQHNMPSYYSIRFACPVPEDVLMRLSGGDDINKYRSQLGLSGDVRPNIPSDYVHFYVSRTPQLPINMRASECDINRYIALIIK